MDTDHFPFKSNGNEREGESAINSRQVVKQPGEAGGTS